MDINLIIGRNNYYLEDYQNDLALKYNSTSVDT